MKKFLKLLNVLCVLTLLCMCACGKQGPLEYPEETDFPRTYPAPE